MGSRGSTQATLDHPPGVGEERATRLGELDAAPTPAAVQQACADLFLELPDLLAQGRLGDPQPLGRAPEVELLGDRQEVADPPEVRGRKYNMRHVSFKAENALDISLQGMPN